MQSGKRNTKKWILEFDTLDNSIDPLMGWENSKDTMSEVILKFQTKDQAISYAKNNNIQYILIESHEGKFIKKSYANNFLKNN